MNNKIISTVLLICLVCNHPLQADEEVQQETENQEAVQQTETPMQEIGLEEAPAQKPKEDSNLKNWLFAAGSIVSATAAIILVSWCQGSPPPDGPHFE